jgi:hypothetical protein
LKYHCFGESNTVFPLADANRRCARKHTPLSHGETGKSFGVLAVAKIVTRLAYNVETDGKVKGQLQRIENNLSIVSG